MVPGDIVALAGTDVLILLVEAHGPGPDCHDCPNSATLIVRSDSQTERLEYTMSGNMPLERLEEARRKSAFGFVFYAGRIAEGEFTIRVDPG